MLPTEILSSEPAVQTGLATAVLIREVEKRLLDLFAEGKLFGTVHTCIGQEWVGVAVAAGLQAGDVMVSNHRCHGHYLARTGDVEGLIAEIMGRETGVCGGRGGSQHLCDVENGFFSNGVQGGMMAVTAGLALALHLKGAGKIAVVFIGDGTLGEGSVYETFNIASKWELPMLIVLENNGYAQSTAQTQTLAGDIGARAAAFSIATYRASTWDVNGLLSVAEQCVERVRKGQRPVFLEVECDRLMAHSKGDDVRDHREVETYWERDPVQTMDREQPAATAVLRKQAKRIVDEAVARAENESYAKLADWEMSPPVVRESTWTETTLCSGNRLGASICEALRRNMQRDARILLIGEDIESPYGGAFKITKGLSDEFPGRVRNTPISEAAIVGMGNGLALGGYIPVCEIMFGDFLTLVADQLINHASKFHHMYNGQVDVPLVIRTPMGGRRGYGPTHSQSLEKHFLGIPHTRVLALHHRYDPGLVYDDLLATVDRATLVIENKQMYTMSLEKPVPSGFALEHTGEVYPTTRLRPLDTPMVTIFCYGGMLPHVEQAAEAAFDEDEISVEVICPIQIYPLNPWPVIDSLRRTGLLLIAEEGVGFAAVGSELIAQVAEQAPGTIRKAVRLASPPVPIPASGPMEQEFLPDSTAILTAIREIVRHG